MPVAKKSTVSTKPGASKAAPKSKASTKKSAAPVAAARPKPAAMTVAKPLIAKAPAVKKVSLSKTAASVRVSRTSNPRTSTVEIKKITRNIVQFHMTEEIEIRRVTKSDNMSKEKLKAKYASLKAKVRG